MSTISRADVARTVITISVMLGIVFNILVSYPFLMDMMLTLAGAAAAGVLTGRLIEDFRRTNV